MTSLILVQSGTWNVTFFQPEPNLGFFQFKIMQRFGGQSDLRISSAKANCMYDSVSGANWMNSWCFIYKSPATSCSPLEPCHPRQALVRPDCQTFHRQASDCQTFLRRWDHWDCLVFSDFQVFDGWCRPGLPAFCSVRPGCPVFEQGCPAFGRRPSRPPRGFLLQSRCWTSCSIWEKMCFETFTMTILVVTPLPGLCSWSSVSTLFDFLLQPVAVW